VGCALVLRLSIEQTISAVGLAVSQAGGVRANFGYDAKSFQAGLSNAAAVRAALLASHGFTAAPDALDSTIGYVALYGEGESLADAFRELGVHSFELVKSGIEVKKYPMGYATHRAIDGVLDLREAHSLTLDAVESVCVTTSKAALVPLIWHRPSSGLEAKFSMEYAVTAALKDGYVRLTSFDDSAVRRDDVQAFLGKVSCRESHEGDVLPRWTSVALKLRDGRVLSKRVECLRGSAEIPLSEAALVEKAQDCVNWVGGSNDISRFADVVLRDLRTTDIRMLMQLAAR
jgi:2-methylcitrate dehydratase PrpD